MRQEKGEKMKERKGAKLCNERVRGEEEEGQLEVKQKEQH